MEVRFKEEEKLYKIIYSAIKNALLNKEFLGENIEENKNKKDSYIANEFNFLTNHFVNKEFSSKENIVLEEKESDNKNNIGFANNIKDNFINLNIENNKNYQNYILNPSFSNQATSKDYSDKIKKDIELINRDNERKIEYKFCGIMFKTYIVIEIDDQMYLIDQHAGHERILYEQIRANYKDNLKNNTQMTLIPEIIDLTNKEAEFVKNNLELFQDIGFDLEFFGEKTIKINGFPDIEYREKINNKSMFLDILDEMTSSSRSNFKDIEERFIATVACKAAVKAGMDLTALEVDNMIQRLLKLQNPYTCPHGRPTTVKFNKAELLSKF
jgi:DNA mismatch repair protein MutL